MRDKDREHRQTEIEPAPAPVGRSPGRQTRTAALFAPEDARRRAANDQDDYRPRPAPRRRVRHGGPADASALQLGSFAFADEPELFVADPPELEVEPEVEIDHDDDRELAQLGARLGSLGG